MGRLISITVPWSGVLPENQLKQQLESIVRAKAPPCSKSLAISKGNCKKRKMRTSTASGELITASLFKISPGMDKVKVNNYYSEKMEEIEIPLNPALSPRGNAGTILKHTVNSMTGEKF